MFINPTIFAALFGLTAMVEAHAGELRPMEGRSFALGDASGTVYYTVERAGLRVVATLGGGESETPIRVEAILAPGQRVRLSFPHEAGTAADVIEIRRRDDRIVVQRAPVMN